LGCTKAVASGGLGGFSPASFWTNSYPYLNQGGGQIVPTTVLPAPLDFQTLQWPWMHLFLIFFCSRQLIKIQKKGSKTVHSNKPLVFLILSGLYKKNKKFFNNLYYSIFELKPNSYC
jgi:hypothetical protein